MTNDPDTEMHLFVVKTPASRELESHVVVPKTLRAQFGVGAPGKAQEYILDNMTRYIN